MKIQILGLDKLNKAIEEIKTAKTRIREGIYKEALRFALFILKRSSDKYLSGPKPSRILSKSSYGLKSSLVSDVKWISDKMLSIKVGARMPYAAIHEYGGTTHPRVTAKMRAWAWAMFKETEDSMYKGIALTKKSKLDITIPPRPYLRPAIDDEIPKFHERLGDLLGRYALGGV